VVPYVEHQGDNNAPKTIRTQKIKAASKTHYTCPICKANVSGKPLLHVICGICEVSFKPMTSTGEWEELMPGTAGLLEIGYTK
jgi:hypothetical protein